MPRKRAASSSAAPEAKKAKGSPLADVVFCITGTLSIPRKQLVALIEENGGTVSGSVTGKTTHLIADAGAQGTTKWNKAKQNGIPIITEGHLHSAIAGECTLEGLAAPSAPAAKAKAETAPRSAAADALDGQVICQTGALSVTRKEFTKLITDAGGKCGSTVTGKTTLLVADAAAEGTAKWNSAVTKGIPIVGEQFIRDVLAGKASLDQPVTLTDAEEDSPMADEDEDEDEEEEDDTQGGSKSPLEGMVICQTGKLSVTRKEFTDFIQQHGGSTSGSVTSKTTHLVADEAAEGTTKWNKAQSMGIPILTEEDLRVMTGESGGDSDEESDYDSDSCDYESNSAVVAEKAIPSTMDWQLAIDTTAFGIFVGPGGMWAGLESKVLYHIEPETGEVLKVIQLSSGCKCIVADMGWIYCGCNDGKVYDITNPLEPRLMYELESANEIQWMDICDGFVAVSTDAGEVTQVNAEGDQVWYHKVGSYSGWMVRSDIRGVYHGSGGKVTKYEFISGKQLWSTNVSDTVLFGDQNGENVLAASDVLSVLDKGTGKKAVDIDFKSSGFPSAVLLDDGRVFASSEESLLAFDKDGTLNYTMPMPTEAMSMQYHDGFIYGVGCRSIFRLAVDEKSIANARKGNKTKAKAVKVSGSAVAVQMQTDVAETASASDGIVVECVKEGSKVRVRPVSDGYYKTWNVQFPRALRKAGAKFVVEELIEAQSGGFYRTKGSIKKLA